MTNTNTTNVDDNDDAYMDSVIRRLYEIHKRGTDVLSEYYATQKKRLTNSNTTTS